VVSTSKGELATATRVPDDRPAQKERRTGWVIQPLSFRRDLALGKVPICTLEATSVRFTKICRL